MLWAILALLPVAVGFAVGRWWTLALPLAAILVWLVGWAILLGVTDWVGFATDLWGIVLFIALWTEAGIVIGVILRRLVTWAVQRRQGHADGLEQSPTS